MLPSIFYIEENKKYVEYQKYSCLGIHYKIKIPGYFLVRHLHLTKYEPTSWVGYLIGSESRVAFKDREGKEYILDFEDDEIDEIENVFPYRKNYIIILGYYELPHSGKFIALLDLSKYLPQTETKL